MSDIQPGDKVMNRYTRKWATVLQVEETEDHVEVYVQPERDGTKVVPATSWSGTVLGGHKAKR